MPTYTTSDIKRAITHYRRGHPLQSCADLIGCSVSTVQRWLIANGVRIRTHKEANRLYFARENGYSLRDMIDRAIRLYRSGMSTTAVGDLIGVSDSTVQLWLRDAGCLRSEAEALRLRFNDPRHPKGRERIANIREAAALRANGWRYAALAEHFDVDEKTIYNWLRSDHNLLPSTVPERRASRAGRELKHAA